MKQHHRSIAVLALIALGIAIVYQTSFVSASQSQQSSELEDRVTELERLVGELSDRVEVLEQRTERVTTPTATPRPTPTQQTISTPTRGPTISQQTWLRDGPSSYYAFRRVGTSRQAIVLVAVNISGAWYKLDNGFWIDSAFVNNAPGGLPVERTEEYCSCSSDSLNCSDFSTQREAQNCYAYCLDQRNRDVHDLDGNDEDGLACESLP